MSNNNEEIMSDRVAAARRAINCGVLIAPCVMACREQPTPVWGVIGPHNSFSENVEIVNTVYWIFSILKPFIHS